MIENEKSQIKKNIVCYTLKPINIIEG
jgi:hypothetical protein